MEFLWPDLLLLLAIIPILVVLYVLGRRPRRPDAVRYSSLILIHEALPSSSFIHRHMPFALFAVALAGLSSSNASSRPCPRTRSSSTRCSRSASGSSPSACCAWG